MDPNLGVNPPSDEPVSPQAVPPQMPSSGSMAASWGLGRIVLISLGVLGVGMLIAFGGFYYGQKSNQSISMHPSPSSKSISPTMSISPTTAVITMKTLKNSNGYTIMFPDSYTATGVGMDSDPVNNSEVRIGSNNDTKGQAIEISIINVSDPLVQGKTLLDKANADYTTQTSNKNTYVATIRPVTKIQFTGQDAYIFTITSHGFNGDTPTPGTNYVFIETMLNGKFMTIVYNDTPDLSQIVGTITFP